MEVDDRKARFGLNELAERPRQGFLTRLWNQLNQFLVLILITSAVVSAGISLNEYSKSGEIIEFIEPAAIIAIVVLNAILGLVQEGKSEQALAALKKMAAPNATVIREGQQQVVPAAQLVPGDLIVLETGNYVPADVRLVESVNLRDRGGIANWGISAGRKDSCARDRSGSRTGRSPELRVYEHDCNIWPWQGDRR